jgi:L-fuconolactonase
VSVATNDRSETEETIEPRQPIVDAHHHLYDRPNLHYLIDEFSADLRSGHDVRATVLVQARAMYKSEGPIELRPVGETEFAVSVARSCERAGATRVAAGIVGYADLTLGDGVRQVLEEHIQVAGGATMQKGRFAGIRHIAAWDPDASLFNPAYPASEDLMDSREFREGFAHLAKLGLTFDAWVYFHQLPRLLRLAADFASTPIVIDHCGGILGIGAYAGRNDEVFSLWSNALRDLKHCPNVMIKLGGLGMPLSGIRFSERSVGPSSLQLAEAWRPYMETCIELFGPTRCMFESNFPPDKVSYPYHMGWNAMKRITAGAEADEKDDLFWRSATRFYGLPSIKAGCLEGQAPAFCTARAPRDHL